ncbi:MAG TPA: serine hydrolase domain-containing protein [Gaiellaceae bacterium]|nr:serine hydrolase domain-containing protein [Gaiellaceae bacterium]
MQALEAHLEAVLRTDVPGAVVVANGPSLSWKGAAGVADAESGAPMTTEHRFLIGSVSKTFVAAVVLQLVGEGALALDEEVGPIAEGVTLRQLLNHTSGLPDYYADFDSLIAPYRADRGHKPNLTPRAALELVHARPRLFPPGAGWEYSGGNYLALGLLVEEATGATLREELKRRVTEPLGLEGTDLGDRAGLARAYLQPGNPVFPDPGEGLDDVTDVELFGWGAGEMISTARDVARFLQALLGGELLTPDVRAELLTTVPSDWEESDAYGLGIEEVSSLMGQAPSPCGPAWGHLGFAMGHTTIALSSESGDRQVVVCVNSLVTSEETWEAIGRLVWAGYCR